MTNMYISIVSHGNESDIINNFNLLEIGSLNDVTVIIRDNLSSDILREHCIKNDIFYNASTKALGFGENNNINFELACQLGMDANDWFVVFNPDLDISALMVEQLLECLKKSSSNIFAINLFFDEHFIEIEQSLRKFPGISSFFNVLKGRSFTEAYDKNNLENGAFVDWAAGSFLVFESQIYEQLGGFDERYFMYFEDVDICFRANKFFNQNVTYLSEIKAIHQGGYKNRNVFSKHFRWYMSSLLRFFLKRYLGFRV